MMPLLETLMEAGQAKHGTRTRSTGAGLVNRSTLSIAALMLLAAAGLVGYSGLQIGPPAPVSLASAALAPPPKEEKTPTVEPVAAPAPDAAPEPDTATKAEAALPVAPILTVTAKPSVEPALLVGYEAYMAGDLGAASEVYERLLASESRNIEALHGMAVISLRLARPAAAEEYFLRALEIDPRDAQARSGLINLNGQGDPLHSESLLKSWLAAQPGLFSLNFTLGNLYAGQGRWSEAERAYFKAVSSDPGNPDALFNLAVSLEQLHQPKLASNYYQRALTAATARPAGFDLTQLKARLLELQ